MNDNFKCIYKILSTLETAMDLMFLRLITTDWK